MANKNKYHVHKYHRRPLGSPDKLVWACALPECTHYQPKHLESMVEGRTSLCNQCGSEFILNEDNMREKNPRCDDCRFNIQREDETIPVSSEILEFLKERES